jgi:hypothetical protein
MSRLKQVTQITSKTTAVRLNAYNGRIKTVPLTDAAAGTFNFTVNNTKVRAISNVQLTPIYTNGTGSPYVRLESQTNGSFVVTVTNQSSSAALNRFLEINVGVV